jgi:glyoxylase-like metal-dependent hydrolase (beta-lactamase superfamily II)
VKPVKVIQIAYQSANCYLIPSNDGWVMIDTGWPDTFSQLLQLLFQNNISVNEVNYLIVTHFHPGHAGLAQNLKDLGTNLILHEQQISYYSRLNLIYKKNPKANFKDITGNNNIILSASDSRIFLESIGIKGELISTPGHSDDSVSLVIDECCAFVGDLPPLSSLNDNSDLVIEDSWDMLHRFQVKTIYPGHGEAYEVE